MAEFKELEEAFIRTDKVINGRAKWGVDGSTSLKLQVVKVQPSDLDILVSEIVGENNE
ncbi:MAG: hypothetical protein ACP5UZ_02180 [Thermoplasmata archaeon]